MGGNYMPRTRKAKEDPSNMSEEPDISIDMTTAVVMEPLPPDKAYLTAVSAWAPGQSSSGGRKIHYELTVVEPEEFANRKVMEDLSLDNEYTLGRFLGLLKALGFSDEDIKKKDFKLPKSEDMLGQQVTLFVRTETSEMYGDRSRIRRLAPASAFKEAAAY